MPLRRIGHVIGGSIWPMPILNRHLTHVRFIGAYNLLYLRHLADTCFSAHGVFRWRRVVVYFCTSGKNEAKFPVEMIIYFSEFKTLVIPSGYS